MQVKKVRSGKNYRLITAKFLKTNKSRSPILYKNYNIVSINIKSNNNVVFRKSSL